MGEAGSVHVHPTGRRVSRRRRGQKWLMPSCKQILPDSRKPWVGPVLVARDALPPLPGPAEEGGVSRGSSRSRAGPHSGCWETAQLRRGRRSGLRVAAWPDVRSHGEEGRVAGPARRATLDAEAWVPGSLGLGAWCSRGTVPWESGSRIPPALVLRSGTPGGLCSQRRS